ncbi:MAG: hypothetical protein WBW84_16735 [Acidobacteriaceae bacterium]
MTMADRFYREKAIGGSDVCHTCEAHCVVIGDLKAEIAYLKGALRVIAESTICPDLFPDETDENVIAAKTAMVTAIAALEHSESETEAKVLMTCPTCHKAYTDKDAATDMSSQMGHIAREHFQSKTKGDQ